MDPLTLSLPPELEGFVRQQVDSGRYVTSGEVVREALELLRERFEQDEAKREWLRAEIQKGFDSGPATPLDMAEIIRAARMELSGLQDAAE